MGNIVLQLAQQEIQAAGLGVGLELDVPAAVMLGDYPFGELGKLPGRELGDGGLNFGDGIHAPLLQQIAVARKRETPLG